MYLPYLVSVSLSNAASRFKIFVVTLRVLQSPWRCIAIIIAHYGHKCANKWLNVLIRCLWDIFPLLSKKHSVFFNQLLLGNASAAGVSAFMVVNKEYCSCRRAIKLKRTIGNSLHYIKPLLGLAKNKFFRRSWQKADEIYGAKFDKSCGSHKNVAENEANGAK